MSDQEDSQKGYMEAGQSQHNINESDSYGDENIYNPNSSDRIHNKPMVGRQMSINPANQSYTQTLGKYKSSKGNMVDDTPPIIPYGAGDVNILKKMQDNVITEDPDLFMRPASQENLYQADLDVQRIKKRRIMIETKNFAPTADVNISQANIKTQVEGDSEENDDEDGMKKNELDKDDEGEDEQFQAHRTDYEKINFQSTMKDFVNKYGSTIEIAGKVVIDAKFFPNDPEYLLQIVNYIQPTKDYLVHTHYLNKTIKEQQMSQLYPNNKYGERCILKLLKCENHGLKVIQEILIPYSKKISIHFSPNCDKLSIHWRSSKGSGKINRLAIYEIGGRQDLGDLNKTLEFIRQEADSEELEAPNIMLNYKGAKFNQSGNPNENPLDFLSDTKRIKFCTDSSDYMACYNHEQVTILSLEEDLPNEDRVVLRFKRDNKVFEGILHCQLASIEDEEGNKNFRCQLACLSAFTNQVIVFDLTEDVLEDQDLIDSSKSIQIESKDDTENMKVKISKDFCRTIYTNKKENYILSETHRSRNGHAMTEYAIEQDKQDISEEKEGEYPKQETTISPQPVVHLQSRIAWLKNKEIRYIVHSGPSDFLLVCCKDYDRDLDIQSSCYPNFKINIPRQIEPNSIKVFDCFLSETVHLNSDPNLRGIGSMMKVVSTRDDEFFVDDVNPLANYLHMDRNFKNIEDDELEDLLDQGLITSQAYKELPNEFIRNIHQDESAVKGFSCYTPFLTLAETDANFQLIYNLNEGKKFITGPDGQKRDASIVHRIELPTDIKQVVKTWITQTFDLFILGMNDIEFRLYYIDLDKYKDKQNKKNQKFKIKELMSYEREEHYGPLLDFHVRGSSAKEKVNLNKKIMVFFLHERGIYHWNETHRENDVVPVVEVQESQKGEMLFPLFDRLDDENIFFATRTQNMKKDGKIEFRFNQIQMNFNEYTIETQFQETEYFEKIASYGYDYAENTLVLLMKSLTRKKAMKRVKILDLDTEENKQILNMKLNNKELIGRLKSQLFFLVNGHMYYNNCIIKIRYDLLRNTTVREWKEPEIFDYYEDNINLENNERVLTNMPVSQHDAHRLIFMTKNKKSMKRSRIMVLPYLHERQLYYGKLKSDCEYFQTAQRWVKEKENGQEWNYNLINVNLTEYKYYTYSLNGIQTHRVDFKHFVHKYGKPKCVSNNGQVFLFKNNKHISSNPDKYDIELTVMWMTPHEFWKMKTFRLAESIYDYIQTMEQEFNAAGYPAQIRFSELQQAIKQHYQDLGNKNKFKHFFHINDNMDVAIWIIPILEKQGKKQKNKQLDVDTGVEVIHEAVKQDVIHRLKNSLFYVQKGTVGLAAKSPDKDNEAHQLGKEEFIAGMINQQQLEENNTLQNSEPQSRRQKEHLFITDKKIEEFKDGILGYSFNNKYIFFWNNRKIWYYNMDSEENEFTTFQNLRVDENDPVTKVKRVRTGSSINIVAIVIRQTKSSDFVMTYNVDEDKEIMAFDHKLNPQVFWGFESDPYVREEGCVYITEQGVVLTCYGGDVIGHRLDQEVKVSNKEKQQAKRASISKAFSFNFGHRFDTEGHSWILQEGYLSLSYSYMTFVMNQKMQDLDNYENEDYLFDPEQYNYVMGKKTALHDESLINDSQKLEFVLKNFQQQNPLLLEQLQYMCLEKLEKDNSNSMFNSIFGKKKEPPKITPLHLATKQHNNKSINIILKYLSTLEFTQFRTFGDLAANLVNYTSFIDFIYEQTFQTIQMQNKSVFRYSHKLTEDIVRIHESYTTYIDEVYYKNKMREKVDDPSSNSYAVKVVALEVGWIIDEKTKDGMKFLKAVQQSERNDVFDLLAIQILIEYLYKRYKMVAIRKQLPLYAFELITFLTMVFYHEKYEKLVDSGQELTELQRRSMDIIACFNGFFAITCFVFVIKKFFEVGKHFLNTVWPLVDVIYSLCSFIVTLAILRESHGERSQYIRLLAATTSIVIWTKSLYFLKRVDQMNVTIEILFQMIQKTYYFMVVMIVVILAFGQCFWLIGRNQIQYDLIQSPECENEENDNCSDDYEDHLPPLYAQSYGGAIRFLYQMCLGEVGNFGFYEAGDNPNHIHVLWILFTICSFFIIVHMMNMLIALMGLIQGEYLEYEQQTILKNKLNFVITNWGYQLIDPQINYLIAAIVNEDDEDDIEIIKEIQDEFIELKQEHKKSIEEIKITLKKIQQKQAKSGNN